MIDLPDKGIYFIYDPVLWELKHDEDVLKSILPDIAVFQMRSNDLTDRTLFHSAAKLKPVLESYKIPFIINNKIGVAIAVKADGVHLGDNDLPLSEARKFFKGIIGVSKHSPEQARKAFSDGADYIGCGPVFETDTKKTGRRALGVQGYLDVKESVDIPVIPIGGISIQNISRLKGIGLAAILSAINCASNPRQVARNIKNKIYQICEG